MNKKKATRLTKYIFLFSFFALFAKQKKPNIVFFLVDDMGIQDTSVPFHYANGKPVITKNNRFFRTPNMEKMAKQGVKFTQAYSYAVCSPTRVSIMTGLAAPRHRVTQWTDPQSYKIKPGGRLKRVKSPDWNSKGIPLDAKILPQLLKDAGYATIFAGKAHFGPNDTRNGNPLNLGFDVNIAGTGAGGPGSYWGLKNFSARHRGGHPKWDIPGLSKYHGKDIFLTEAITREVNNEITKVVEKTKKPFFAYVSHYAVHVPFETDRRFAKNYPNVRGKKLAFATMVEGMDKSLGDIIENLEKLGVAEDTLIIFYSDNGTDSLLRTPPLKGKKGKSYEAGPRVPLMFSWAKINPNNQFQKKLSIQPNSIEEDMVNCVDIMPTVLSIAEEKIPSDLDGYDIKEYVKGGKKTYRPQEFLTHFPHRHNSSFFSTYRLNDYKIIYNYAYKKWELYNLVNDPGEKNNLVKKDKKKALDLAKKMIAKLDSMDAQYPIHATKNSIVKPNLCNLTNFNK